MLEGCSEACPAHVALQAAVINVCRNNCCMTKLSWLQLYHAVPLFLAIRKKAFFFPNVVARAEQKKAIRNVHLMRMGF